MQEWGRTSRTSEGRTEPRSSIRSCSWYFSRICSRSTILGPSPPNVGQYLMSSRGHRISRKAMEGHAD